MADDKNDIDEWLDESVDNDELDQLNIDALLSDGKASEEEASTSPAEDDELDQTNIDALFDLPADSNEAAEEPADLDQDNIDALLGGTEDPANKGEEPEEELAELDQDNIDALFADADTDTEPDEPEEEMAELDQDNIDALLGGTEDPANNEEEPEEELAELDQDNIDALFADADADAKPKEPEEEMAELDQDNIDALFAEEDNSAEEVKSSPTEDESIETLFDDIDAAAGETSPSTENSLDELFSEDEEEDKTQLSTAESEELASTAFDSDFDEMDELFSELEEDENLEEDPFESEEIDFAEMLGETDEVANDEDEFLDLASDESPEENKKSPEEEAATEPGEATTGLNDMLADAEKEDRQAQKSGLPIAAALSNMNKTMLSAIGGGIIILLLIGIYALRGGDTTNHSTAIPPQQLAQQAAPQTPQVIAKNSVPEVADSSYAMTPQGGEVTLTLAAKDQDGQDLNYTVTDPPQHGRLSGTAPLLTYLPNQDFPGKDHFTFTASDGKDVSPLATITITGPDLGALARAKQQKLRQMAQKKIAKKLFKPRKPKVLAKNVSFYTTSTAPVVIDWQRLWQEANKSAFSPETHVEIVANNGQGQLQQLDHQHLRYTPDPYSAGIDTITYRFKKGGFRSATKTISIDIELGSPAPEVNFAHLEERYEVGQKVVLDASPSRDEQRGDLRFHWQQIRGVPVEITPLNKEGSKIAFVMPSSFYTAQNNSPAFRVYAKDSSGQVSSNEITVTAVSRRQTALWRGEAGTSAIAEEPEMSGRNFPWPYDD